MALPPSSFVLGYVPTHLQISNRVLMLSLAAKKARSINVLRNDPPRSAARPSDQVLLISELKTLKYLALFRKIDKHNLKVLE
jgi:hypothetical protein